MKLEIQFVLGAIISQLDLKGRFCQWNTLLLLRLQINRVRSVMNPSSPVPEPQLACARYVCVCV